MTINSALRLMSGLVTLASLALGLLMNPNWLFLTAFVGLNLFQAGFTRWCPAVYLFNKMGLKSDARPKTGMSLNQGVHIIAGSIILGTTLAFIYTGVGVNILVITGIIGLSLTQSAFTGWCPAMIIAKLLGFKSANAA